MLVGLHMVGVNRSSRSERYSKRAWSDQTLPVDAFPQSIFNLISFRLILLFMALSTWLVWRQTICSELIFASASPSTVHSASQYGPFQPPASPMFIFRLVSIHATSFCSWGMCPPPNPHPSLYAGLESKVAKTKYTWEIQNIQKFAK